MDKLVANKIFHELYSNIDGYKVSKKARLKQDYYYNADIYGEIDFNSFYDILTIAKPQKDNFFYDLGSGTGKAVIMAALCFPFAKSIGVEKLDDLYTTSVEVSRKLGNPKVEFIQSDFNDYDFSDGDVIYLNSYYFYYDMYSPEFMAKMQALKYGTRVIFVQVPIIAPFLQKIHEKDYKFSWGDANVYVMIKV